uniref:protein-L-isoaspartate(D-aspartate) O-methyltransferase n=1 Tax=Eutreptiella gymnastica TaxID=73025 RepID=A0A7S4FTI8_9EUGL
MSAVDLYKIQATLAKHRQVEPAWKTSYAKFLDDSRVAHLEAGGYVFENLSVYMTLIQLLAPAVRSTTEPPRVLDVGCGTGFLTMVMAHLVAPNAGHVTAIDVFERQVQHAERDMRAVRPDLLPVCTFAVANAWSFQSEQKFDAIAVAAQCATVPQNLVALLKPGGRLVLPLGPVVPINSKRADKYNPYWLVEAGAEGEPPVREERAGPISVNFLPLLPVA